VRHGRINASPKVQAQSQAIVLHTLDTGAAVDRPLVVVAIRRLMGFGREYANTVISVSVG